MCEDQTTIASLLLKIAKPSKSNLGAHGRETKAETNMFHLVLLASVALVAASRSSAPQFSGKYFVEGVFKVCFAIACMCFVLILIIRQIPYSNTNEPITAWTDVDGHRQKVEYYVSCNLILQAASKKDQRAPKNSSKKQKKKKKKNLLFLFRRNLLTTICLWTL